METIAYYLGTVSMWATWIGQQPAVRLPLTEIRPGVHAVAAPLRPVVTAWGRACGGVASVAESIAAHLSPTEVA